MRIFAIFAPVRVTSNGITLPSSLSQSACSCTDCPSKQECESVVPDIEIEIENGGFKVGQMDGVLFVMILVAGVGSAILLPLLCYFGNEEKMGNQEGEVWL